MKIEKREIILKAVEEVIKTKRFHEVKMDDVAKQAGVGKGTIYRYFPNKDELYFELAVSGFDSIKKDVLDLAASSSNYEKKFLKLIKRMEAFFLTRKTITRVMRDIELRYTASDSSHFLKIKQHKIELRNQIAIIMQEGLDKQLLKLPLTAAQYAEFWVHQLIGLSHWPSDLAKPELEIIIALHLGKLT